MNILLEGIFYNGHGLAEGNRMLLRILDRAGYCVRIIARDQADRSKVLSPEEIDYISSFEHTILPSNDLYIFNWVGTFVNYNADFRINIARTTFETDRIPKSWVRELNKFKEVWVQSKFNKHTFASSGVDVPLKLIPNFFDIKQFTPQGQKLNLPISESFTFLSIFDLKKRKGYDVLLRAYLNEFSRGDDVALVIKIRDSSKSEIVEAFIDKHPKAKKDKPAVYVIDQMLETKELLKLYRTCDTFVLPTRGEGWGRPFFEAMLMEMPVIGTNWSGHTDFMVKENSFLVDVKKLVKIDDPENALFEGHYWAEPSLSDLQKKMRLATKTNKAAKEVARNARLELLQKYSTHETSRKVIREIAKYEKG